MPAPSWPPGLPTQSIRGTYSEEWGEQRLISQTDAGPAKIRRRTSAMPTKVTFEMYITFAELEMFTEFYEDILRQGSVIFAMPYPPKPSVTALFSFATPPTWQRIADQAYVRLDLKRIP